MEPAVLIRVCVGAIVVVVLAIGAGEKRAFRLSVCVIVPIIIAVDFEVVPDAIVVVVYVPVIVNAIEVVVEICRVIEHALWIHIARNRCTAVVIWVDVVVE